MNFNLTAFLAVFALTWPSYLPFSRMEFFHQCRHWEPEHASVPPTRILEVYQINSGESFSQIFTSMLILFLALAVSRLGELCSSIFWWQQPKRISPHQKTHRQYYLHGRILRVNQECRLSNTFFLLAYERSSQQDISTWIIELLQWSVFWESDGPFSDGKAFQSKKIRVLKNKKQTQRNLLHTFSLFDPVSIAAPVEIRQRILQKNIWRKRLWRDDQFTEEELPELLFSPRSWQPPTVPRASPLSRRTDF